MKSKMYPELFCIYFLILFINLFHNNFLHLFEVSKWNEPKINLVQIIYRVPMLMFRWKHDIMLDFWIMNKCL